MRATDTLCPGLSGLAGIKSLRLAAVAISFVCFTQNICFGLDAGVLSPADLRTEYASNPLGINVPWPILPASPGYRAITIKPHLPKGLTYVNSSLRTVMREIVSNWDIRNGYVHNSWEIETVENIDNT